MVAPKLRKYVLKDDLIFLIGNVHSVIGKLFGSAVMFGRKRLQELGE